MRVLLAELRKANVTRVWVAIDGPKDSSQRDEVLATHAAVRAGLDPRCEVKTRFQTDNLGCRNHVVSAIDWFFGQVEAGIILVDDCIPSEAGLSFLSDMLVRYANSRAVFSVCLDNSLKVQPGSDDSYFFAKFPHIWGWATWKRAWSLYDSEMAAWKNLRAHDRTQDIFPDHASAAFWSPLFDRVAFPPLEDTWDWQWTATHFVNQALSIHPGVNLVSNIGFGASATHTKKVTLRANAQPAEIYPLRHPSQIIEDEVASKRTYEGLKRVLRRSRPSAVAKSAEAVLSTLTRILGILRITTYRPTRTRCRSLAEGSNRKRL